MEGFNLRANILLRLRMAMEICGNILRKYVDCFTLAVGDFISRADAIVGAT